MRMISLSDPPFTRRSNDVYQRRKADLISREAILRDAVPIVEERILKFPLSTGKVSVFPKDARHTHVGGHWVIWWRVFQIEKEVEFIQIGHHNDFF